LHVDDIHQLIDGLILAEVLKLGLENIVLDLNNLFGDVLLFALADSLKTRVNSSQTTIFLHILD
jgi:hypothetical protein